MPATVAKARVTETRIYECACGVAAAIEQATRVDRAAGIIYGVKVLGVQSVNPARFLGYDRKDFGDALDQPYSYSVPGMKAALPMYENASVFSDHLLLQIADNGQRVTAPIPQNTRHNDQLLGWLQNCRVIETGDPTIDGIYADWHLITSHSMAAMVMEVAEKRPDKLGLSHEAFATNPTVVKGRIVLNEIANVEAVALVCVKPGTVKGLFESQVTQIIAPEKKVMPQTIRTILAAQPVTAKGRRVLEMASGDPMAMGDIDVPVGDNIEPGSDAAMQDAIKALVNAILDDTALDIPAKLAKIGTLLELSTAEKKAAPAEKATESAEKIDRSGIILECADMLTTAGLPAARSVVESMAGLETPAARQSFVNTLKGLKGTTTTVEQPVAGALRSAAPPPAIAPTPVQESAVVVPPMTAEQLNTLYRTGRTPAVAAPAK